MKHDLQKLFDSSICANFQRFMVMEEDRFLCDSEGNKLPLNGRVEIYDSTKQSIADRDVWKYDADGDLYY